MLNPFPTEVNGSTARGNVAGAPVAEDNRHSNAEHLQAGRAALLIQPNDRLSITFGYMHQSLTQDGPNTIDSPPLTETHYQPFDVSEPFEDKFDLYTLTGKYNFDSFQLVSASAYWDRQQNQTQVISVAMQDYIGGFFWAAGRMRHFHRRERRRRRATPGSGLAPERSLKMTTRGSSAKSCGWRQPVQGRCSGWWAGTTAASARRRMCIRFIPTPRMVSMRTSAPRISRTIIARSTSTSTPPSARCLTCCRTTSKRAWARAITSTTAIR